jgi:hypothetical protein
MVENSKKRNHTPRPPYIQCVYHFQDFNSIDVREDSPYMKAHIQKMLILYKTLKKNNSKLYNLEVLHKMVKTHFPEMLFE